MFDALGVRRERRLIEAQATVVTSFFLLPLKKQLSAKFRNVAGPQIRTLRDKQGWSQPTLAAKCQLQGWNVTRDIIARIELQLRWVADFELMILAHVFKVGPDALLPRKLDLSEVAIAELEE